MPYMHVRTCRVGWKVHVHVHACACVGYCYMYVFIGMCWWGIRLTTSFNFHLISRVGHLHFCVFHDIVQLCMSTYVRLLPTCIYMYMHVHNACEVTRPILKGTEPAKSVRILCVGLETPFIPSESTKHPKELHFWWNTVCQNRCQLSVR